MSDEPNTPLAEFGFPGAERDALVGAILAGTKTSTTSLLVHYEIDDEPLPTPGDRQTVVDSNGEPVTVIEITSVTVTNLGTVDWDHVQAEGEGHASIAEWRTTHETFWHSPAMRELLHDPTFTVSDSTLLVLERFQQAPTERETLRTDDRCLARPSEL